jgi:hypothetical protein
MDLYSKLVDFDTMDSSQKNLTKDSSYLSNLIYSDIDKMTPEEMKVLLPKCYTDRYIKNELLKYEFYNYKHSKKSLSLDEFKVKVQSLLKRYQYKVGGFLLEDSEWRVYDQNTNYYAINHNCLYFENSIDSIDKEDMSTQRYLNRLTEIFNSLTDNITTKFKIYDRDNCSWVLFKITDMTKDPDDADVAL